MRWRDRRVREAEERLESEQGEQADRDWLAWAEGTARRQNRVAVGVAIAALALIVAALAGGCTREQCQALPPIQLPEKAGGIVEREVLSRLGVELAALTPPGFCPLYVAPMASEDHCLQEHELTHVDQFNAEGFVDVGGVPVSVYVLKYKTQFGGCLLRNRFAMEAFLPCYLDVSYEVAARVVQERCARGGP